MMFNTCTLYTILSLTVLYNRQLLTHRTTERYFSEKNLVVKYHFFLIITHIILAKFLQDCKSFLITTVTLIRICLEALPCYCFCAACGLFFAHTFYILYNLCFFIQVLITVMKKYLKKYVNLCNLIR